MFRAANYRAADFFPHGKPEDPRIHEAWNNATACFDRAIGLLDVPAERIQIDGGEFYIPEMTAIPRNPGAIGREQSKLGHCPASVAELAGRKSQRSRTMCGRTKPGRWESD
jgi:hypothetical protein